MRVGLHVCRFDFPGQPESIAPTLAATAAAAEAAGVAEFTFMDHYFQIDALGAAEDPMLEGYTSLGYIAGISRSMMLGLVVTAVAYRHPGLLAKIVTTLDVLSGGRAQLGIGAGGSEREHAGLGVPLPPVAERFERLEEALQICRQMWSDDNGPYQGRHYQLAETLCVPRPIQRPRPRIRIGGGGERKTLRLVARYGDECNLFASTPAEVGRKLDVLREHCAAVGRDPAEIETTILSAANPAADPDAFLAEMAEYAQLGTTLVSVMPTGDPVEYADRLAAVIPALAELG